MLRVGLVCVALALVAAVPVEPLIPIVDVAPAPLPLITIPLRKVKNVNMDHFLTNMIGAKKADSFSLTNNDCTQYVGDIYVGDPAVKFGVILDTGSANTWVYASACASGNDLGGCSSKACQNHAKYTPENSKSYVKNGTQIEITYGSGVVRGHLIQDQLSFDPDCRGGSCIAAKNFFLLTATCVRAQYDIFDESPFDGVMGLGFEELGVHGTKPLVSSLIQSGALTHDQNMFAFYLTAQPNQAGSVFTVGGADPKYFEGTLKYHDVIPKAKHWSLRLTDVQVNGKSMGFCSGGCPIVPDTGTSLITGPDSMIEELDRQIGPIKEDCSNIGSLPTIQFKIDSEIYDLGPEDYVFRISENGKSECYPGYYGMSMPAEYGSMWIAGDLFLKKYYSVYDVGAKRVGLARARHV